MAEEVPSGGVLPSEDQGWAAHKREKLTLGLAATPAERLAWLEEMIILAHRTGALPREPDPRDA
jgi:hypothetical protein